MPDPVASVGPARPRARRVAVRATPLAVVAAMLTVAVAVSVGAWEAQSRSQALNARVDAITASANRVLVDLLNAETGQRGFLLTGQPAFLEPYWLGTGAIGGDLAALTRASRGVGRVAGELPALRSLDRRKLAFMRTTIQLARSGRRRHAVAEVDTDLGKDLMDRARSRVAAVERFAADLPASARRAASAAQAAALAVDGALIALALLGAGWFRARARRSARARTRVVQQLAAEARLERALRKVGQTAARDPDESETAEVVAAQVCELLDASLAVVLRAEPDGLRVAGFSGTAVFPPRIGWDEDSSAIRAVRTGLPARIHAYDASRGEANALVIALGMRHGISVPVRVHGRVWGCLTANTTSEFGPEAERWLARFAALTAAALDSAEARAQLRTEARLEVALREVAELSAGGTADERQLGQLTAERIAELLGAASSVWRFDDGSMTMLGRVGAEDVPDRVLDGEPSVVERVRASGKPARVENYGALDGRYASHVIDRHAVRCAVGVPIFVEGRAWGALTIGTTRAEPDGQTDVVMERFASLVSAALANAQAKGQLRQDARIEHAMRTIASAGASGQLDETTLADLAASQIADLLGAPAAVVIRFDEMSRATLLGQAGPFPFPDTYAVDDPKTITAMVADTGKPARIDDYTELDASPAKLVAERGVAGAIAVPVHAEQALWGCLCALTHQPGGFPAGTEALLERVGEVVSLALGNVRSLHALRREAAIERTMREVVAVASSGHLDGEALFSFVVGKAAALLDAPVALLAEVSWQSATPVGTHGLNTLPDSLPLIDGTASKTAWTTDRPTRVDDYQGSPIGPEAGQYRSAIAAPVHLHGKRWGYLAVGKTEPSSFAPQAELLLQRFSELVASVLAQADALTTLKREATTDGLTGLLNHRAFHDRLHADVARATRSQQPLSVLMFDLDGFKQINDQHGHRAGDRVLQAVADALNAQRRAGDIAARVGGDEFAIIAPDTTAEQALGLADRVRAAANAAAEKLSLHITVSAGVTDLTAADTLNDLIHLADSALYHAKHHGRDRAVLYAPGPAKADASPTRALVGLPSLVRAVDARDSPTRRHAERVATISTELASRLGWTAERRSRLREAALLHDVGKLGVPDNILKKPGPLTDAEYEIVKRHAALGAEIAQGLLDEEQVGWVRSHHERPDGRGYPDALTSERIPDGASLLAVADAYDAMTSERPYRSALPPPEAISEMRRHIGTQFDAQLLNLLESWTEQALGRDRDMV